MTSDAYLQHALNVEGWSRRTKNPCERAATLETAAIWRTLALRRAAAAAASFTA